ncbi:hypothetical protein AB833_13590 [Chromatiales bacterium (ex Bugula neritina AB1)]|nr:hypothetical protein AB833_13590 [Chromatiales bacterium (ex Bugula neritina AB1)]
MVDFKSIDEKTNLAGTNRLEILMFTLEDDNDTGTPARYGINVFKVRELITLPKLIQKPNMHDCAAGIANIRGKAVPVIDLQKYYGCTHSRGQNILVVTEFNGSTQGFIVREVDKIIQLDWKDINEPPEIVSNLTGVDHGNTLTGISLLEDASMLMVVDVEQVITEVLGFGIDVIEATDMVTYDHDITVVFADDSRVARKQVSNILDKMGIKYHSANNGQEAYELLDKLAKEAEASGHRLYESIKAVITDVEMPALDGYMLTRRIKEDSRFEGIPVMMHSSLSATENIRLGNKVGVDAYVPKLRPKDFSETLDRLIHPPTEKAA